VLRRATRVHLGHLALFLLFLLRPFCFLVFFCCRSATGEFFHFVHVFYDGFFISFFIIIIGFIVVLFIVVFLPRGQLPPHLLPIAPRLCRRCRPFPPVQAPPLPAK
jgi:hypothetical protein